MSPIVRSTKALTAVYWLPGLPHLLQPEMNSGYRALYDASQKVRSELTQLGVQRLFYFSTSWISVLGQLVQTGTNLKGVHTDENWHMLPDLKFDFKVDQDFGRDLNQRFNTSGFPSQTVDYRGFPVDTATIVADRLINPSKLPVSMLGCHVYSDHAATETLAAIVRESIEASGLATAVVCVTGLSGRYFTTDIDLREDRVSDTGDDAWNQKILGWLATGDYNTVSQQLPAYAVATKADMGLKAFAFTKGLFQGALPQRASCYAYGGLYGTGAAVVKF